MSSYILVWLESAIVWNSQIFLFSKPTSFKSYYVIYTTCLWMFPFSTMYSQLLPCPKKSKWFRPIKTKDLFFLVPLFSFQKTFEALNCSVCLPCLSHLLSCGRIGLTVGGTETDPVGRWAFFRQNDWVWMDLKKLIPALWRLEGGKEGDSLVKGNDGILKGPPLLLMVQKSEVHQLRLVVSLSLYFIGFLYIPSGLWKEYDGLQGTKGSFTSFIISLWWFMI